MYDLTGTESKTWHIAVHHIGSVKRIIEPFREASLVSLEAAVFPSAPSVKIPVTVDLAWTPADVSPDSSLLQTPGAIRLTIGSLETHNHIYPANLNCLNPIIKSHLPYTDSPRLNLAFKQSAEAVAEGTRATIKASVIVRGLIAVSHPLLIPA